MMLLIFPWFLRGIEWVTLMMAGGHAWDVQAGGEYPYMARYLANGHTLFNLVNALIFLIFLPFLIRIAILSDESVCFHISHVTIEHQTERFRFLERLSRPYEGKELSLREINDLVTAMNRALMSRGFSTSRVAVPEQNLSSGELRLVLLVGYIHAVRFADGSDTVYWKNLFPFRAGDVLNVRDIEQGIEQAKRLPSQDISVRLLLADEPQMTDIELTVKRSKNIYGTISFDDSGLEDTSRLQ